MSDIDIIVEDPAWSDAMPDVEARTRRAAQAALVHSRAGPAMELTILLTDDAALHALNRRFRGHDEPTNVLAFPATEPDDLLPEAGSLGDLALAYGTCGGEAAAQGKPFGDHLAHLVVHGVLHLLGRDHQTEAEAEAMEEEERLILVGLGIADPYRELAFAPATRPGA